MYIKQIYIDTSQMPQQGIIHLLNKSHRSGNPDYSTIPGTGKGVSSYNNFVYAVKCSQLFMEHYHLDKEQYNPLLFREYHSDNLE